jgi:hypothetical protein
MNTEIKAVRSSRHELDRRRPRLWSQHAVEDASGVSAIFGPVGGINFVVETVVSVDERHILLNTAGTYPALVPLLGTTEPISTAPANGSDEYFVAVADGPHGDGFTQHAVAPNRRELHLFGSCNPAQLVAGPLRHLGAAIVPRSIRRMNG